MIRKIFFPVLAAALLFPSQGFSDEVTEGETTVEFKIVNLSEYSKYQFFYYYQSYYYDQGYQPGEKTLIWIEEGKEYSASDRGEAVPIMARLKSDTTQFFETEASFGGTEIVSNRKVERLIDEIRIKGIVGEHINVKTKRYEVRKNGDRVELKEGGLGGLHGGPFQFFGINGLILLMPLAALLSLLLFFLWRKNLIRRQDASYSA